MDDPYDLNRFVLAQDQVYDRALAELRAGMKQTHWIWYILPQIAGLGMSPVSQRYAIKSIAEAEAYLAHPVLRPRLVECCEATVCVEGRSASVIMGPIDDLKLRSCVTLFAQVAEPGSVFERVLAKYFGAEPDEATVKLIGAR